MTYNSYQLQEVCSFIDYRGKTPPKTTKGIPLITAKIIKNGTILSPQEFIATDYYDEWMRRGIPKKGSIVFTTEAPLGEVAQIKTNERIAFAQRVIVLEPNPDILDANYLLYALQDQVLKERIKARATGTTVMGIKAAELKKVIIDLPPLPVQREISDVLCSFDNKIELNQRINDNLERQAQAFFQELFIDNACPDWPMGTICDLGAVVGGSTPSKKRSEYYTDNGIAWITPKDLSINKSKFILHGENDITELGLKNSSASIMPEGTVLFSSRAPIGYIAIAAGEVTTNQGFKSVVPKPEIGTAYVYYFLKHNLPTIEGMASGSTFKEVSASTMKSVPAIVPDKRTLMKFNDFCTPIFAQQKKIEEESRVLAELRNTLLPKLMAGEIEVPDIYIKPPNYEICLSNYKLEIEDTP